MSNIPFMQTIFKITIILNHRCSHFWQLPVRGKVCEIFKGQLFKQFPCLFFCILHSLVIGSYSKIRISHSTFHSSNSHEWMNDRAVGTGRLLWVWLSNTISPVWFSPFSSYQKQWTCTGLIESSQWQRAHFSPLLMPSQPSRSSWVQHSPSV